MQSEIIRKLNSHIATGITTEADVVYLFVQLGKLLEQRPDGKDYPTIQFYRNWLVHHKLDRPHVNPEMRAIFERLEAVRANGSTKSEEASDYLSMGKLSKELEKIFRSDKQFDALSSSPRDWPIGGLLLSILADLPLILPAAQVAQICEFRFIRTSESTSGIGIQISFRSGQPLTQPL